MAATDTPEQERKPKKRGVAPLVVILVVCLLVAVGGGGYMLTQYLRAQEELARQEETPTPEEVEPAEELPANPIDFGAVKVDTPDAYAWIYIPDTGVNYPIMRSATDDNFYLRRNEHGEDSVFGSIFTQSMNALDFSDPVTLIYGHNTANHTMFGDVRQMENPDYFASHETMYIYTPGHILTYRIIASYMYDDRHIMNSFDFTDVETRLAYFDAVLHPTSMSVNVREGATLDENSKIVQLSTCPDVNTTSNSRFIVTGVLIDDQPTQ